MQQEGLGVHFLRNLAKRTLACPQKSSDAVEMIYQTRIRPWTDRRGSDRNRYRPAGYTRRCHTAIIQRGAEAIIPVRRNGRLSKEDGPTAKARNEILRASRHFGRAFWKRWSGYHSRGRVEARMRCLKAFGARIMARDPDRQTAEIHHRRALMNRFSALGTAEIVRVD